MNIKESVKAIQDVFDADRREAERKQQRAHRHQRVLYLLMREKRNITAGDFENAVDEILEMIEEAGR